MTDHDRQAAAREPRGETAAQDAEVLASVPRTAQDDLDGLAEYAARTHLDDLH